MSFKNLKKFGGVLRTFRSSTNGFDGRRDTDTLAISAINKWSDERLGLTKTVIYCVYGFCE